MFFFIIAIKLEQNSMKSLLNSNLKKVKQNVVNNKVQTIIDKLNKVGTKEKLNELLDKTHFSTNNKKILKNTIIIIGGLIVSTIMLILYLLATNKMKFKSLLHILGENIITFTIIIIIEMIFFFQVILEYVPVKESFFFEELINEINNNIQS